MNSSANRNFPNPVDCIVPCNESTASLSTSTLPTSVIINQHGTDITTKDQYIVVPELDQTSKLSSSAIYNNVTKRRKEKEVFKSPDSSSTSLVQEPDMQSAENEENFIINIPTSNSFASLTDASPPEELISGKLCYKINFHNSCPDMGIESRNDTTFLKEKIAHLETKLERTEKVVIKYLEENDCLRKDLVALEVKIQQLQKIYSSPEMLSTAIKGTRQSRAVCSQPHLLQFVTPKLPRHSEQPSGSIYKAHSLKNKEDRNLSKEHPAGSPQLNSTRYDGDKKAPDASSSSATLEHSSTSGNHKRKVLLLADETGRGLRVRLQSLLGPNYSDLIPTQDTESYLLKTQNAISNLQAKLNSSRTHNLSTQPNLLTSSLISEKSAISRLPVSQLSRSNSLNYRLRRKDNPDSSPLRSPGHYVITGSAKVPETTKILINAASRSLDTERRQPRDSNMNSPCSERGLLSNSSDDKTLSNRPQYDVEAILSPHRKTHERHRSFDMKPDHFIDNHNHNANKTVCLKTVLKNNALDVKFHPRIDQTRCLDTKTHQRVFSDGNKHLKTVPFGCSIKRSSSFNTVNKNNNYEPAKIITRRSSGHSDYKENYLSDESENDFEKDRYKVRPTHRRIDSPDLKSVAPANSPSRRCPNTPEMQRKFGPGLVRNSVRVTNKERAVNSRMSEPPIGREERNKPAPVGHQSRRISEPTRQAVFNRLTKSRSSTRELQPKNQEKGPKRPSQYRSSSALASKEKEKEFTNWKKRSSYDPMKAAQEGRRKQMLARRQECCKDDLSSPSHSSPVHRSQSFHTTNIADLTVGYSSDETDELPLPVDPMVTSTHSDILELVRPKDNLRRKAVDVVLNRDYVTSFQVNQPPDKPKRQTDKRKTYIVDDITPTKENIDFLSKRDEAIDKRKTFILDSDTNSTTNGSSPRNSSIFSHEKNSLTTCTSDTEGESGTESAPVVMRHPAGKRAPAHPKQRYSGDYSMSSSTTSISQKKPKEIQPRYLDISKYRSETSPRNFLRKDPSKTYIAALGEPRQTKPSPQVVEMAVTGRKGDFSMSSSTTSIGQKKPKEIQPRYLDISKYRSETSPRNFLRKDPSKTYIAALGEPRQTKPSPQLVEMEQKKQELEKWKRRASYDPRKAAALGKAKPQPAKTASSVLRSQSFHGPMLVSSAYSAMRHAPPPHQIVESYDASSDNDF
ncbi:hypothetical protein O0L34_g18907 [Tuta absoluta]|nr:hypothetical protein O0L34_g18907 [Tuta absoluta]